MIAYAVLEGSDLYGWSVKAVCEDKEQAERLSSEINDRPGFASSYTEETEFHEFDEGPIKWPILPR